MGHVLSFTERAQVEAYADKGVGEVCDDARWLKDLHTWRERDKRRIRDIVNGGPEGLSALLGQGVSTQDLYAGNFILSGMEAYAQKFANAVPDLRVPVSPARDSERARTSAEKVERIIRAMDSESNVKAGIEQSVMWTRGYGFTPWQITERTTVDGYRYPHAEARDSFNAYPSKWSPQGQPDRIAYWYDIDVKQLERTYNGVQALLRPHGNTPIVGQSSTVQVCEYVDEHGTWWTVPDREVLLDFTPNPLERAPFVLHTRLSFDRSVGKYDQSVGLLVAMAKMNTLALIAMEDAVFSETVVAGELAQGNTWKRGPGAVNYVTQGTSVARLQQNLPYQMFQEIDRIERQFRIVSGYSVIEDGQSPNSFVTGRGLSGLMQGADNDVHQDQQRLSHTFSLLDALRLEYDEKVDADTTKPIAVFREGQPYVETYRPDRDIKGRRRTDRKFGVMAGFDDSQKIVTGLQLLQAEIIDHRTLREAIDGLDNATEIEQRIRETRAERQAATFLDARAQQGDEAAMIAVIEQMGEGPFKETLKRLFTPEGDEPSPEEQAMGVGTEAAAQQGPESAQTVLARLMEGGQATLGAQTVGTMQGAG